AVGAPVCNGTTCTVTFDYTGGNQSWTAPAGVSSATFDLFGAQGGGNQADTAAGGKGAEVKASLPVTPGETLQVVVGGAGEVNAGCGGEAFNGGGGLPVCGNGLEIPGGGGGASDVRQGGADLAHRVLVAGGGGGAGGDGTQQDSGQVLGHGGA